VVTWTLVTSPEQNNSLLRTTADASNSRIAIYRPEVSRSTSRRNDCMEWLSNQLAGFRLELENSLDPVLDTFWKKIEPKPV